MSSSSKIENVGCPICDKEFPVSEIERHADRCSFLKSAPDEFNIGNRPADSAPSKKRQVSEQLRSPQITKRAKNNGSSSSGIKALPRETAKQDISNVTSVGRSGPAVPLAEQMRPSDLSEFVGQEHILGHNKVLRTLLEKRDIPSMILWGPPGCGKTTLAHIIATICRNNQSTRFVKLSATLAGVNDVKEVVKIAKNEQANFKRQTILFMDEIHRFNKLQQDIFLPHVESGAITLIGATTENPSFSLNSALLSRCRVIVLEKLQTEQLEAILARAIKALGATVVDFGTNPMETSGSDKMRDKTSEIPRVLIEDGTVLWLAEMCDGDARIALNSLQLAVLSREPDPETGVVIVTLDNVKDGVKRSHLLYDKKGDQHYDIISAVHKSIRASDDNAALYWVTRMIQGGEDPRFIARRLVRAASEDIGLADPAALPLAVSVMQGCQLLGMPESDVLLAQCAIYLARAPKSTEAYKALGRAKQCIDDHQGPHPSVPLHLRNAPTRLMKDLGYGQGYNMLHKSESKLQYMPQGLEDVNFFN